MHFILRDEAAFTLMEASVALFIIGILIAIALPMLNRFIDNTDQVILQSQLLRAINLAREEAYARDIPTVLCKSNDRKTCSSNAKDNLIIFLNENEDGMVHVKDHLLTVIKITPYHGNLYWRLFPRYRDYLLFLPTDMARTDNGTFWYCYASGMHPAWAVILNKSGRTRVVYPNKNGEIKDSQGQPLLCV
jgi:Tfp pilus assembly protein FimT